MIRPEAPASAARPDGRLAVCFVAPTAYGAVSGRPDYRYFGGAEVQQVMLARELARRGHEVSMITLDHGQPEGVRHDGIHIVKSCAWHSGWPGLRFLHPRWTSLWSAMSRADAQVYYQRGAGAETGQVALWCRFHGRPFVFAASSDTNAMWPPPDLPRWRERALYRYGLHRASGVVCQTHIQAAAMEFAFGVQGTVVRSCTEDGGGAAARQRKPPLRGEARLLWVGRLSPLKRFELLLEVAAGLPDVAFDVLGGEAGDGSYARGLLSEAKRLKNVTCHGWLPHPHMAAFYRSASLLLCTSPLEGFPNTFIEAWAQGTPTVSTVDPDRIISERNLGAVGAGATDLRAAIERLLGTPEAWRACSRRARRQFEESHTVAAAAERYEELLQRLGRRAGRLRL